MVIIGQLRTLWAGALTLVAEGAKPGTTWVLLACLASGLAVRDTAQAQDRSGNELSKSSGQSYARSLHPAKARRAAEGLALLSVDLQEPGPLIAALAVLLKTGASLAEDDPWRAPDLLNMAKELSGGDPAYLSALSRLAGGTRGACVGHLRSVVIVSPDIPPPPKEYEYELAGNELTVFEARPHRGSGGADIDLRLLGTDGSVLSADTGSFRGVAGRAAFIEWTPEQDMDVLLEITNLGPLPTKIDLVVTKARPENCQR